MLATSWIPPRCWQGAYLLNDSTKLMLQQARGRYGGCHVCFLPGYIHICRASTHTMDRSTV